MFVTNKAIGDVEITINAIHIDNLICCIMDYLEEHNMSVAEIDMALAEVSYKAHDCAREQYSEFMESIDLDNLN